MKKISKEQLRQWIESQKPSLHVIDVLSPSDYRSYHLPTAVNCPIADQFEKNIKEAFPNTNDTIVVYCSNAQCKASPRAADILDRLGYVHVYHFEGGKEEWRQANFPIVSEGAVA